MAKGLFISRSVFTENHWSGKNRDQGILIRSEEFPNELRYVVKKNELALLGGGNGVFCLDLAECYQLGTEIIALADCYDRSELKQKPRHYLKRSQLFQEVIREE